MGFVNHLSDIFFFYYTCKNTCGRYHSPQYCMSCSHKIIITGLNNPNNVNTHNICQFKSIDVWGFEEPNLMCNFPYIGIFFLLQLLRSQQALTWSCTASFVYATVHEQLIITSILDLNFPSEPRFRWLHNPCCIKRPILRVVWIGWPKLFSHRGDVLWMTLSASWHNIWVSQPKSLPIVGMYQKKPWTHHATGYAKPLPMVGTYWT